MYHFLQLLFFLLVFLFPVGIYLTVLAGINRQPHPVLVPGPWDAAGLLFASSGFLLAAGPAILSGLYQRGIVTLTSQAEDSRLLDVLSHWGLVWGAYYGFLIVGTILFLWARRNQLLMYNVDPATFDLLLTQVLERLNVSWSRQGRRVFLWRATPSTITPDGRPITTAAERLTTGEPPAAGESSAVSAPTFSEANSPITLLVDPFSTLYTLTLHWRGPSQDLRREMEDEMRKILPAIYTRDNPTGGWLFSLAGGIFGVLILGVLLMLIFFFTVLIQRQ